MLLISSPETPKSQSLICPCEFTRMFEGLTSKWEDSKNPKEEQRQRQS